MHSLDELNAICPKVHIVKIDRSNHLSGNWVDRENVFTFIASGLATFIIDGVNYVVSAGDAVIFPPGVPHFITSEKGRPFSEYIFHFDLFDAAAACDASRLSGERLLRHFPMVIRLPQHISNEVRRVFLMMYREFVERQVCTQGVLSAYAKSIIISVYRCQGAQGVLKKENAVGSWNSIRSIVEVINNKYQDPRLSIKMIADIVGFSPNYASTLVKETLGVTIHSYISHVRTEAAKNMLYESNKNITQVAEQCGYSSVYAFSRAFKRVTGLAPTQFARTSAVPAELKGFFG